jgi:hypothetical protein
MKDFECAFPDFMGGEGMTLPQYAAIKLRVPRSGDPDIDAMIRESRRADFAGQALAGLLPSFIQFGKDIKILLLGDLIEKAYESADAMIAELEKEAESEKGN